MAKKLDVYQCDVCGHAVELLHAGAGALVCCNKPMRDMKANTTDASKEKHVPVIERLPDGLRVTVGSIPPPMEEQHFIEWIGILFEDRVLRQSLKPGQPPTATFAVMMKAAVTARESCNLHGIWKA
jgi:superoxide reductase